MGKFAAIVKNVPAGRFLLMPLRLKAVGSYYLPKMGTIASWLVRSREHTNFTYNLSETNFRYLAHSVSLVTHADVSAIEAYLREPLQDEGLRDLVRRAARERDAQTTDVDCRFGRRLAWYAVVRQCRPRLVVETGVDKGLGSVLLCSALKRNAEEGYPGEYVGTDINPRAGALFQAPYTQYGKIAYGDSIETLKKLEKPIDVFINDSDHSSDYEYREYQVIAENLSPQSIIIGDNCSVTDKLMQFSRETDRHFLYFMDEPDHHWFPGTGVGFSFKNGYSRSNGANGATH
jgi:predicted O-methyltransferase YrrM